MRKAGRFTAALLLVLVGAAVIIDKMTGMKLAAKLMQWWPLIFISLGVEYIFFNMSQGKDDRSLKMDVGGLVFAVMLSSIVLVATQNGGTLQGIRNIDINVDKFNFDKMFRGEETERRFEKDVVSIPLTAGIDTLKVDNMSGRVTFKAADIEQVQVAVNVAIAMDDEVKAKQIADQMRLEHDASGGVLTVRTVIPDAAGAFLSKDRPRTDLTVTVPSKQPLNIDLQTRNGDIEAAALPVKTSFVGETTNGKVRLSDLRGDLRVKTTNGAVATKHTGGQLTLTSTDGAFDLADHQGDIVLSTTNGQVDIQNQTGALDVRTTNAGITAAGSFTKLQARTTNGDIVLRSDKVAGRWEVKTSDGDVDVRLPRQGDYRVEGHGREDAITTDLPLKIDERSIEGVLGGGTHMVELETDESLSVNAVN